MQMQMQMQAQMQQQQQQQQQQQLVVREKRGRFTDAEHQAYIHESETVAALGLGAGLATKKALVELIVQRLGTRTTHTAAQWLKEVDTQQHKRFRGTSAGTSGAGGGAGAGASQGGGDDEQ